MAFWTADVIRKPEIGRQTTDVIMLISIAINVIPSIGFIAAVFFADPTLKDPGATLRASLCIGTD